jgi:hypothetical protein
LWAESTGNSQFATLVDGVATDPTATADTDLQLLEGTQPIYSINWTTSLIDGATPNAGTTPSSGDILGAVSSSSDWTQTWTYGIHPDSRGQSLWFE